MSKDIAEVAEMLRKMPPLIDSGREGPSINSYYAVQLDSHEFR
jgi:hypothetical protein